MTIQRRPILWAGRGRGPAGGGGGSTRLWTPGGGSIPVVCTFIPNGGGSATPDLFGAFIASNGITYTPGSPVYPASAHVISGANPLYGTPNNGVGWGLSDVTAMGPSVEEARWTWDLGASWHGAICRIGAKSGGGWAPETTIESSDDGTTWATEVAAGSETSSSFWSVAVSPSAPHRYWSVHVTRNSPLPGLQFMRGFDFVCFMLWGNL